jgi:hypothetical protein
MAYEIWGDNENESLWFQGLDSRLKSAKVKGIGKRGSNSKLVDSLVVYDRPDIILFFNDQPILVLEKTAEVPTGHNVGQRVARLVRAAEHEIPVLYFLPFDARKHGKHTSICSINTRLLKAMVRMSEIHNVPVLPVQWPCKKSDGELVNDGTQDNNLAILVSSLLDSFPKKSNKVTKQYENWLEEELERRNAQHPPYRKLPTSAKIEKTSKFLESLSFGTKRYSSLLSRSETLIYKMDMSPDKCRREDPYTGTQFIYDYGWLREGPRPFDRNSNLLIHVPKVTMKRWNEANPNDPERKSSNWYLTADGIVLKDGIILIEHKEK